MRIGAWKYNGATYVVAVNTSTSDAGVSFSLPGLGGRSLRVFRDWRVVKPLGVAVCVVARLGW